MKKMVTKLWRGKYVSIRDYEQKKAITKGGLRLERNGQVMELSVEELKLYKPNGAMHQSKYGGQYQLIDIEWKPVTVDPRQGVLNV